MISDLSKYQKYCCAENILIYVKDITCKLRQQHSLTAYKSVLICYVYVKFGKCFLHNFSKIP